MVPVVCMGKNTPDWYEKQYNHGYPRFGVDESDAHDLQYAKIVNDGTTVVMKDLILTGAGTLATGFAAVAAIALTF